MTIIDTTLYANGALRLSRHGAGRGGNVLMHVPTGQQCNLSDRIADAIAAQLSGDWAPQNAADYYERVEGWYGFRSESEIPAAFR